MPKPRTMVLSSELVTSEHLGGYVEGGAPATWFPDLWTWLILQGVTSMLDVGFGEGHALNYFRSHGCTVIGVEGIEQPDPDIVQHDFTDAPGRPTRTSTSSGRASS